MYSCPPRKNTNHYTLPLVLSSSFTKSTNQYLRLYIQEAVDGSYLQAFAGKFPDNILGYRTELHDDRLTITQLLVQYILIVSELCKVNDEDVSKYDFLSLVTRLKDMAKTEVTPFHIDLTYSCDLSFIL